MREPSLMWNSKIFSTQDLERFEQIEAAPGTENEIFLCGLVERFFLMNATQMDKIKELNDRLDCTLEELEDAQS